MKEEKSAGPELEWRPGARKPSRTAQPEPMRERPGWRAFQDCEPEPEQEMQQCWETQWQGFLKTMQNPHSAWENPRLSETAPWDDAKAFLASFEQVAAACQWPREEWVARLLPALSGEAKQAFSSLETRDQDDYGKVKAAILRDDALRREAQRQHFRQFCCQKVEDPRRMYGQLQELCCKWLKPEKHTKEQILELLVLEQFLASLPPDLQSWIRAGGPDSCSQAVALVEDFIMGQREAEAGKWQGLFQEERMDSLEAEEEHSEAAVGKIYQAAKENGDGDIHLLGNGIQCPSHSSSLPPPEEHKMAEGGPRKGLMNLKETGVSSYLVGQTLPQSQQTTFWQVLPEGDENVDSSEGLLVPKPDLFSHPQKLEETSHQFPVESEQFPGPDSGDGKESQFEGEHSQCGGNGLEETPRPAPQRSQEDVLVTAAMPKERRDEKRNQIKVENPLAHFLHTEKTPKMLAEITEGKGPVKAEMCEEICESNKELKEEAQMPPFELSEEIEAHTVHSREREPSFSRYGRRYRLKSSMIFMNHPGEEFNECPTLGGNIQHQRRHTGEQSSESRKKFHERANLCGQVHRSHKGGKTHDFPKCGKGLSCKLARQLRQHTGEKIHTCPECGKKFTQRGYLTTHLRTHTGEKPYKCSDCGRGFSQRSNLSRHHRIHTGVKPYKCLDCGKCFTDKRSLLSHHRIYEEHLEI